MIDKEKRGRNERRVIASFDTINFTFLRESINAKKAYRKVYHWRNNNIFDADDKSLIPGRNRDLPIEFKGWGSHH